MRLGIVVVCVALTGCTSTHRPAAPVAVVQRTARFVPTSPTAGASATGHVATVQPSTVAPATPRSGSVPPVVPWADLPYQPPAGSQSVTAPRGGPPWCRSTQLRLTPTDGVGAGAGELFLDFQLRPAPGQRCALQGWPIVTIADSGHKWSVAAGPPDPFAVPPGGAVDHAHPGSLDLRWGLTYVEQLCSYGDPARRHVTVTLPHEGGTLETTDDRSLTSCGQLVAQPSKRPRLTGPDVTPLQVPHASFFGGLYSGEVSMFLVVPQSAPVGRVFSYRVWLSGHRGSAAYTGRPCFGYRQSLGVVTTSVPEPMVTAEEHALNCAAAGRLPARGRFFAMRIRIPATVRPGTQLELFWQSDAGGSSGVNETSASLIATG